MSTRRALLGELETLVMLATLRLDGEASARRIREEIATRGGRRLSRGATYATLSRLENKGLLDRSPRHPAGSGSQVKHLFAVTENGLAALRIGQQRLIRMRTGLESILDVAT